MGFSKTGVTGISKTWGNRVWEFWNDGILEWCGDGALAAGRWSPGCYWFFNDQRCGPPTAVRLCFYSTAFGFAVPGVFAHVDRVRFADDQRFRPCVGVPFPFQGFDQAQKAVLEFKCLAIEHLEIFFGELVCLEISVVSGHTFSERAYGDIKMLDIFSNRSAEIAFGDIPVDRIGRSDRLPGNPLHFECRWLE